MSSIKVTLRADTSALEAFLAELSRDADEALVRAIGILIENGLGCRFTCTPDCERPEDIVVSIEPTNEMVRFVSGMKRGPQ